MTNLLWAYTHTLTQIQFSSVAKSQVFDMSAEQHTVVLGHIHTKIQFSTVVSVDVTIR